MTFEKAYSPELDTTVTAYNAKRKFFAQDDTSLKYSFFCPDKSCSIELTAVNVFTIGKFKQKPHFRTKKNCHHIDSCSIIHEVNTNSHKVHQSDTKGETHGFKHSIYPTEFISSRPKLENSTKIEIDLSNDIDEIEPKKKRQPSAEKKPTNSRPHKTSYLENIVDSFEDMDTDIEKNSYTVILNSIERTYKNSFKDIIYFEDGKNFIFYGKINPIKKYGKNFSIKFQNKAWYQNRLYQVSIYIKEETINTYRLSRHFRESMEELSKLGDNFQDATCYFVNAYPKLKEISISNKNLFFSVLNVEITNLDLIKNMGA